MRSSQLHWRRHWKVPAVFVALVATLVVGGVGIRVRPVVSAGGSLPPREAIENITNEVDLFDDSLVHHISVQIDPDDRARMLTAYRERDEKIVVPAAVTIDGVEVPGAGIRLKGNSSLAGIHGDEGFGDEGFGGAAGDEFAQPGSEDWEAFDKVFNECLDERGLGDAFDVGLPNGEDGFVFDEDDLPPGAVVIGPDGSDDFAGETSGGIFDGFPETLHDGTGDQFAAPYLIVVNHTNKTLRYQGHSQLALRTDGNGTILAEPVTIAAYEAAGLPAPKTSMTGLSINGEDERLYGITTVLDQDYVDFHFGGADGALFKATALQSQDFSYEGEDQSKYPGFTQVTATKRHDKTALIDLLRFTDESSDAEFAAGLPDRVDIDALARLLAINNLLVNTDSLGTGPGGNYYLFNNATDGRIVPLGWDFNYSLGGLDGFNAQLGPDPLDGGFGAGSGFAGEFGAGAGASLLGGGGAEVGAGDDLDAAFAYCDRKAAEVTGMEDLFLGGPEGAFDENGDPIELGEGDDFFGGANRLVERFLEVPEFAAAYTEARSGLIETLFSSGFVSDELDRQIAVVDAALAERPTLAPRDKLTTQNDSLTRFVKERAAYLG